MLTNMYFSKVKVKSLSRVQLFETPWTVAYQAPPSMEFSRKQYWILINTWQASYKEKKTKQDFTVSSESGFLNESPKPTKDKTDLCLL